MSLDFIKSYFLVFLSFIFFIVLNLIPLYGYSWLKPDLIVLCLIYWVISSNNIAGIYFAFILGIFCDLLTNNILGVSSLALAFVAYLTNILKLKLNTLCLWQQVLTVALLVGFYKLFVLWGVFFTSNVVVDLYYWASIVVSILFWPLVYMVLRYYQQLYKIY